MDFFEDMDSECYEHRCGEIYLSSRGNISIHCTLCEVIFKKFESYTDHLYKQHASSFNYLEDISEIETVIPNDKDDDEYIKHTVEEVILSSTNEEDNTLDEDIKLEIHEELEELHHTALIEEEMSIEFLRETHQKIKSKSNKKTIASSIAQQETTKGAEVLIKEITIPKVVRSVKRRTRLGSKVTPSEDCKHKCPICFLAFRDRSNMKSHVRRHIGERKFECPECKKKFYEQSEVRAHMKIHTDERNFLCSDCGKSYKNNSELMNHIKRHKNQRDFKCENCDKAFFNAKTLRRHMLVHTGERPFACTLCSSKFSQPEALKNHMKLHENKREYKCKICEAGFNQKAGLFSHMKVNHKTKQLLTNH